MDIAYKYKRRENREIHPHETVLHLRGENCRTVMLPVRFNKSKSIKIYCDHEIIVERVEKMVIM